MPEVDVTVRGLEPLMPFVARLLLYILFVTLLWFLLRRQLRGVQRSVVAPVRGPARRGGCSLLGGAIFGALLLWAFWALGFLDSLGAELATFLAMTERLPRALWLVLIALLLVLIALTALLGRPFGARRR